MNRKEISSTETAGMLGIKPSRYRPALIEKAMNEYGYKFAREVPTGEVPARSYWKDEVADVKRRNAEKRRPVVAAVKPVASVVPIVDEDALKPVIEKLDGVARYSCNIGDNQRRLESKQAGHDATLRLVVIGVNRLLKAAGLQEISQITPVKAA